MSELSLNQARLHVAIDGDGPETIVFCHGLLFSGHMFDEQVAVLRQRYRCVRMDFRGQGQSEITPGGYDMDSLADDVIALIEHLDAGPVHLVGFSMGGFVGLRVALRRPTLLRSLVLMNTSAEAERPNNQPRYKLLNLAARLFGLRLVAPKIEPIMFSEAFRKDPARRAQRQKWMDFVTAGRRIGATRAVNGVTHRTSVLEQIDQIDLPTLIIAADQDHATPQSCSERMHQRIKNSKLVVIEQSGHMTTAEAPEAVNQALLRFYEAL